MSGTAFELALEKRMKECVDGLLTNPPGNPDKDTMLKAKYAAFNECIELYRKAMRAEDDDGDKV